MVDSTIEYINQFSHVTLIVRSTVPGHDACHLYFMPLAADTNAHSRFNWRHFSEFDRIWQSGLAGTRHRWLDVTGALALRADGHMSAGDCLHYCMPGPPDVVNILLYHMIMDLP